MSPRRQRTYAFSAAPAPTGKHKAAANVLTIGYSTELHYSIIQWVQFYFGVFGQINCAINQSRSVPPTLPVTRQDHFALMFLHLCLYPFRPLSLDADHKNLNSRVHSLLWETTQSHQERATLKAFYLFSVSWFNFPIVTDNITNHLLLVKKLETGTKSLQNRSSVLWKWLQCHLLQSLNKKQLKKGRERVDC